MNRDCSRSLGGFIIIPRGIPVQSKRAGIRVCVRKIVSVPGGQGVIRVGMRSSKRDTKQKTTNGTDIRVEPTRQEQEGYPEKNVGSSTQAPSLHTAIAAKKIQSRQSPVSHIARSSRKRKKRPRIHHAGEGKSHSQKHLGQSSDGRGKRKKKKKRGLRRS